METVNRIKAKSVGQVRIFEITGNFMGDFARNGNMAIRNALQNRYRRCALFNLSGVKEIDEQGINAILGNSDQLLKSGVLVSNDEIKSRFLDLTNHATNMKVLNDDFDVTIYFSHEFAEKTPEEELFKDKREHVRLKTILPLKFRFDDDPHNHDEFFAVVTNLSEGGLFAEYIHSKSEDSAVRRLDPSEGAMLDILLYFSREKYLKSKARVLHGDPFGTGVGMEFLGMSDDDKLWIRDWIAENIVRFNGLGEKNEGGNG